VALLLCFLKAGLTLLCFYASFAPQPREAPEPYEQLEEKLEKTLTAATRCGDSRRP